MTSEQRDELNARVQAMEEKKRELRARGVPWVEVCRQVGGLDVRELVKRAGSEKPRKQVRDC